MKLLKDLDYSIVVRRRPRLCIYVRKIPSDIRKWREVHDPKLVSPGRLKSWLTFAQINSEMRGEALEKRIERIMEVMGGKKLVEHERKKREVDLKTLILLYLDAGRKGLPPWIVDDLVELKKKEKERLKKLEKIVSLFA